MPRMPRQKVLMVVLGCVELPIRLDLGDDCPIEDARLVELSDIGLGDPRLLGIRRKDCRAILCADIRTLAIELGWIMDDREINLQDPSIADLAGVERDPHGFRMAALA